jgi:hypothetical protein
MEKILQDIFNAFENFKKDATANIEKGYKAAGTRARKTSNEIAKMLKSYRALSVENDKK